VKVGDLVRVVHPRLRGHLQEGSYGVVTEVHGPTIMFAYEVISVVFSDGKLLEGIPSRWFEVMNEVPEVS
jgi:hypothetical protein